GDDHRVFRGAGGQGVGEAFELYEFVSGQGGGVLVIGGGGGDDGALGRGGHAGVKTDHRDAVVQAVFQLSHDRLGGQGRQAQRIRLLDQLAVERFHLELDVCFRRRAIVVHFHIVVGGGVLATRAHGLPE